MHLPALCRASYPWDREKWGGVRKSADQLLREAKVITLHCYWTTTDTWLCR